MTDRKTRPSIPRVFVTMNPFDPWHLTNMLLQDFEHASYPESVDIKIIVEDVHRRQKAIPGIYE